MSALHRSDSVRRASFGLISAGYLALAVSAAMNLLEVPLAALLLGVAYRLRVQGGPDTVRRQRALRRVCVFGAVACSSFVLLDFSFLSLAAEWAIWGGLAMLFGEESERGYYASFALALVQLVIAGGTTDSVVYAIAIVLFIVSGTLALAVMTLRGQRGGLGGRFGERAARESAHPVPVIQNGAWEAEAALLRRLTITVSGVIVSATIVLFFVIPRYGAGYFFSKEQVAERKSAFSDTVEFGAIGSTQQSGAIAMRVEITGRSTPFPGVLRYRGVGLGYFDGRRWTAAEGKRTTLQDQPRGFRETTQLVSANFSSGSQRIDQRIYLTQDSAILFGATRVQRVWGKFTRLVKSAEDTLEVRFPAYSSHSYTVTSEVGSPPPAELRLCATRPYPAGLLARYTQLPPGIDPRVRELALKVSGDAKTPYDAMVRLEAWLSREYAYELPGPGPAPAHPVEEFLFVKKKGHCEYFAATLAVMARTLGIPARVANGYAGGTWSRVGGYYMIADSDAHSWVEVFFQGQGWLHFDATPQDALVHEPRWVDGLLMYWDAVLMGWRRYVVDYHLLDQIESMRSLASFFRGERPDGNTDPALRGGRSLPPVVAVVLIVGLVLVLLWRALVRQATASRPPAPLGDASFYLRVLEVLARRGFPRHEAQTPRELAASVAARWPAAATPLAALTAAYERVRFGGRPLGDATAIQALLKELERAEIVTPRR